MSRDHPTIYKDAVRFLTALNRGSIDGVKFFFATFDDSLAKRGWLAKRMEGTLAEVWPELVALSKQGAGVFVTINESTGTKKVDVTVVRGVWRDYDGGGDPPDTPLEPQIRARTANGVHDYWLTSTDDFAVFDGVMQTMVAKYGADPNAVDRGRVLRLPGFLHQKNADAPFMVRVEFCNDAPPYSFDQITKAFPPTVKAPKAPEAKQEGEQAEGVDDAELIRRISTAEDYHGSILTLTARYVARGVPASGIVAMIEGVMKANGDDSDRAKSRLAEVLRTVQGAVQKFAPGKAFRDVSAEFEHVIETVGLGAALRSIAANHSLSQSEVDALLQQLKTVTGTSLGAMREDLKRYRQEATADEDRVEGESHHDYAQWLLDTLEHAGHSAVGYGGKLYVPGGDGLWHPTEVESYAKVVADCYGGLRLCERASDFRQIAGHAYAIALNPQFFDNAPRGLAAGGMFYRLTEVGDIMSEPLTLEHRQYGQLPEGPDWGESPLWDRFLAETFDEPEQIELVQEIAGAVLFGLMAAQEKAVMFYGGGRGGKGTTMKMIETLVPSELRSAVSPFKWDEDYHLGDLAGKRLNVVGELPKDVPIPAAAFKTVTGRDSLSGRFPYGRPFTFKNEAAHIFSSNHLIVTRDHSEAFFQRWIIVHFKNSRLLSGAPIDVDLGRKIVAEELPQLLAWATLGAMRLQKRGRFVMTPQHDVVMTGWRYGASSVLEFLRDEDAVKLGAVGDKSVAPRRREVYDAYRQWARRTERRPLGLHSFNDELDSAPALRLGISIRRDEVRREVVEGLTLCEESVF